MIQKIFREKKLNILLKNVYIRATLLFRILFDVREESVKIEDFYYSAMPFVSKQ